MNFLMRMKKDGLSKNLDSTKSGLVFVKENVSSDGNKFFDKLDNSVWRTPEEFKTIFIDAGFDIILDIAQDGMPKELHEIKCFVLKPKLNDLQRHEETFNSMT